MLVFFYIFIAFLVFNLIILFSSIGLEIEKISIDTTNNPIVNDYRVNLYLSFLSKIKYLKIELYKEKIDKMKNLDLSKIKKKIAKLKLFKNIKEKGLINNTKTISKVLKTTHIKLEKMNLEASIGIGNTANLAYLIAFLNICISIILSKKVFDDYTVNTISNNYKYNIIPKQTGKGYLKVNINAEFSLKISNIVKNILYSH